MKIVFAGSPEYAVPTLESLFKAGKNVAAVITQPDRPVGRKHVLTPTPVKTCALSHGVTVYDFAKIRAHVDEIKSIGADIMITCAYGQILTREILDCFPLGVWNLHASLLPKFRGASPVQSAILAGESHTGVTVMKTELELDTGDILLVKRCAIENKTYGELSQTLSELSAQAALEAVGLIEAGETQLLLQNESLATYCKKVAKSDGRLDFSRSALEIVRIIKAFSPQPAAFCNFGGSDLNILNAEVCDGSGKVGEVIRADKCGIAVACGDGAVLITRLQLSGGKAMLAADFVNGRKIKAGDILD